MSNRLAICPKRRQLGCRATAQSHCRLCKPHRRASFDHLVGDREQPGHWIFLVSYSRTSGDSDLVIFVDAPSGDNVAKFALAALNELLPLLEAVVQAGKPLLIIAEDASISLSVLASRMIRLSPMACAAACVSLVSDPALGYFGLTSKDPDWWNHGVHGPRYQA